MFAGNLVFETPVDTTGVETGSKKIEGEFGGLKNVANETGKAIKDAFSGDFSKPVASAQAKINDLLRQLETVSVSFKEAVAADDDSSAEKYGRQRIRIYDQIEAAREKLSIAIQEASQKQAEAERKAAEKAEKAHLKSYSNMRKSFSTAERTARRFGTRLRSIISGALVFNLISSGLRGFTSYFGSALKTNKEFTTQLAKLKGALLTAFQPIYTYVLPVIVKLMQYLTSAANAVAYFFSILTGSSIQSTAKAAENLYNEANAIGAVGGAAKKAKKALAGFDEINVLQSANDEGSGVGSSTITPDFSGFENSELSKELEAVMGKLETIAGYIPVIVAGFGGLKLGSFLTDLATANIETKTLKDALALLGKKTLITLEIGVMLGGLALFGKGIVEAFKDGVNGINFAEILGGGIMGTGAAAHLGAQLATWISTAFSGSAVANALATAAANLGVGSVAAVGAALVASVAGIILGIPTMIAGIYDAIVGGIEWLNAALIVVGSTVAGAGIGAIIGMLGGPIGAGIGALIGACVGILTGFGIWLWQSFDAIENWLLNLPLWGKAAIALLAEPLFGIITIISGGATLLPLLVTAIVILFKKAGTVAEGIKSFFQSVFDFCSGVWTDIQEFFEPAVTWFSELFQSVSQTLEDIFYNIGVIAAGCWELIKLAWRLAKTWFHDNVIQPIFDNFSYCWTKIKEAAANAWAGIKQVLLPAYNWLNSTFIQPVTSALTKLWTGFSKWASDAWIKVKNMLSNMGVFLKGILNGLIGLLNSGISNTFGKVNDLLSGLKSLEIAGVKPFANIRTISTPQIPYLAKGAVLPANKPFMAVVGDQKHGTNVEAPLTVIQEAMAAVMEEYSASNLAGHQATVAVLQELLDAVLGISVGDEVIAAAVQRYDRKMAVVRGGYV